MAMRLTFDGMVQYVRQWIKDTAKLDIDEPLAQRFVNMAYLETSDRAMWKVEHATPTLVAGTGEYSMTALSLTDMIRPILILLDGKKMIDTDYESLANLGCFDSAALQSDPLYVTFQTGSMTIRPIPDATAAAKTLTILYAASPTELVSGDAFDDKFRTAWQEIICWLVLKRCIMVPRDEESQKLFMTPGQIENECDMRLRKLKEDVWSTAVSARKIKDRSQDTDEKYLDSNFFT